MPDEVIRLSEVVDELVIAGYPDSTIQLLRQDLFRRYPKVQEEAYSRPMQALPGDPVVPASWAREVLKEIGTGDTRARAD